MEPNLKYHKFEVGNILEHVGIYWKVSSLSPGYYLMDRLDGGGVYQMNTEYVEYSFTKVKTFEDEINEL